jgi:hypothetical protein
VRINQRPSKIIPKFLPAKLFVIAISSPFSNARIHVEGRKTMQVVVP